MATRRADLDDDLRAAVLRARQGAAAAGELAALGQHAEPLGLDDAEQAAWHQILSDGTYRRAAEQVAASDPEIANC